MQKQLETAGHNVTCVSSDESALQLIESATPFDLIRSDIVMTGGLDGLELVTQAIKIRPDLVVILMTGYAQTVEEDGAMQPPFLKALCQHALKKPFSFQQLMQKIQQTMER